MTTNCSSIELPPHRTHNINFIDTRQLQNNNHKLTSGKIPWENNHNLGEPGWKTEKVAQAILGPQNLTVFEKILMLAGAEGA